MSDTKKTKPGPEPERLVIEDDPGEALDRLLGKGGPDRVRSGAWIEFHDGQPSSPLPFGRYEAVVKVGQHEAPIPAIHFSRDGYWHIQPGGAIEPERNIRRVRWLGELPK